MDLIGALLLAYAIAAILAFGFFLRANRIAKRWDEEQRRHQMEIEDWRRLMKESGKPREKSQRFRRKAGERERAERARERERAERKP